jgi:hypothetical protein
MLYITTQEWRPFLLYLIITKAIKMKISRGCRKIIFSVVCLFSIHFSSAQKAGSDCDKNLWNFVWEPSRLQVLDKCKTVTGVIVEENADPDGDEHMLLKLDAGQESLLEKKNYSKKGGNLVIEAICINHITRKAAKGICKGYANHVQLPEVGDHVRVTGSYVLDSHNGWTEIHPITRVEKL